MQEILRGQYPMGSRMPTVRELAERFDVNVATVQRALARLEATGLVTARQGSGIHVEDPAASAEVSIAPAFLQAALREPALRQRVLKDFLDLRRGLMTAMLIEHRSAIIGAGATLLGVAIEHGNAPDADIEAKLEVDEAFLRALLNVTGDNTFLAWLANTAVRMLRQVPHLAEAYFIDSDALRRANLAILHTLLTHTDPGQLWVGLNAVFRDMDTAILERFEATIAAAGALAGKETD